jgi:lipopolysaccharide transport system ATP-binding protein
MSNVAIRVEGLGKRYRLGARQPYRTFRESLAAGVAAPMRTLNALRNGRPHTAPSNTLWALRDLSFEVNQGEVVGIVGRNGAGKSTLLKILSRVTAPTEGEVDLHGRVASLLEVGTGFHPELTGRENIFLNGSILGMRSSEIQRRFDEIVSFAELEQFLDTPVKHYSSGMYMRLAFAVAAHLHPQILLVDEVLAVGDAAFQKKCLGKMHDVAASGRTVLFVSHNLIAVENLCTRALHVDRGRLIADGKVSDVLRGYVGGATGSADGSRDLAAVGRRRGSGELRFTRVEVLSSKHGQGSRIVRSGESFAIRMFYTCRRPVRRPVFSVALFNLQSVPVFAIHTSDLNYSIPSVEADGYIDLELERVNLMPGRYVLHLAVGDDVDVHRYDHLVDAAELDIEPADVYGSGKLRSASWSLLFFPCRWQLGASGSLAEVRA